jgi:hypothetical protein
VRYTLTPPPETYRPDFYRWALQVRDPGGVTIGADISRLQAESQHWQDHAQAAWSHLQALSQQFAMFRAELERRGLLKDDAKDGQLSLLGEAS